MTDTTRLLFVCLGNICRSPLAEGIFLHLARERGVLDRFRVDSCGTGGWHVGNRPDRRALAVARKYGVSLPSRARQLDASTDGIAFDLLLAMDADNARALLRAGVDPNRVRLMRSFDATAVDEDGNAPDVPDPYYGGDEGFDRVFDMLTRACNGLLDELTGPIQSA